MVDNNQLTTLSELTPHIIYTIRVQALTSVGPGPLSLPVQIKTQQGVPSQPEMLTAIDIGETKVTLQWNKPTHSAENILSYELYWNDTYAKVGLIQPVVFQPFFVHLVPLKIQSVICDSSKSLIIRRRSLLSGEASSEDSRDEKLHADGSLSEHAVLRLAGCEESEGRRSNDDSIPGSHETVR